jgi:3-hydroxyisobutyrate dehydrogenase
MRIGFLGTGIMGAPMARHLAAAGHDVTAWNRTPEKARPLAEHGIRVAASAAEAAEHAEVVVTMLADADAVEEVIRDSGARDTTWWQASTVGIEGTERLVLHAGERGLAYVDGPVLGTRGPAEEGRLTVLAAGPPDAVERCAPLFDAVAARTIRLADAGAATRLKLVLNHWVLAVTDGIAETIAFAEGIDVDPRRWLEAIQGGTLDIGYAGLKGPGMIEGDLPVAFPLRLALKDCRLMLDAARRHDIDLGIAPVICERLSRAAAAGHADDDFGMVIAATRPSAP